MNRMGLMTGERRSPIGGRRFVAPLGVRPVNSLNRRSWRHPEVDTVWLSGQLPPMNVAILCAAAVGIGYGIWRLFGFYERLDDALKHMHETHPDIWEAIGRPVGRLWSPNGTSSFRLPGPTEWLNWVEGQAPDWHQRLDPATQSRIDTLRTARQGLPLAAGVFVCGSWIAVIGLAVG